MRIGEHIETLSFIVALGMETPFVLGLACLLKWNLYINWRRKMLKIRRASPKRELKRKLKVLTPKPPWVKPRREVRVAMKECPKGNPQIPKDYWDLWDIFSEKDSDLLPSHCPTDPAKG